MALGGGVFVTQNKVLPGSYINFVSASAASATLSDRGTAAFPITLGWGADGKVFTVTAEEFQKDSLKIFGYPYTADELKGLRDLFLNVKDCHFYKLNTGGANASCAYAKAKYPGERGNVIMIKIRAVTIECASDTTAPYAMNDKVYATLIELCVDICKRNGKSKLVWLGDKNKTLAYTPKSDEMLITVHRWFANKSCPGDWLYQRLSDLASKVTEKLSKSTTNNGNSHINENMTTRALYKVQCGAFTVKANATALQTKLKAKGFDTYIVQVGKYFKVQIGAYSVKANAEATLKKLQAAGYNDAFITYTGSSENVSSSSEIKVGDKVKVLKATTYAGKSFKLYYSKYDVLEVNGDRVVIGIGKTVTAAVHKDNLQKI